MTKQTIVRVALVVLVLAVAAALLITCSNNGAPAAAPDAAPAATGALAEPAGTDSAAADSAAADSAAADAAVTDTGAAGASAAATAVDTAGAESAGGETAAASAGAESTTGAGGTDAGAADSAVPFAIDQGASEARFIINESLLGMPTEVVGVTNLISGTLAIDPADPAATTVGVITIDARSLATDRDLRNRAIRRFILESNKDEYRYITFTPTAITGLPATAAPGDTFTFEIAGDLQIKEVVQPATFQVELTADSATQVSGVATATVLRSDFNLQIPNAPGVADVTDEVRLELAFTAIAE